MIQNPNQQQKKTKSFLKTAGTTTLAAGVTNTVLGANDEIVLGIIGTGGRGQRLLKAITNIKGYRVAAVCDLVQSRVDQAAFICEQYKPTVRTYRDFSKMMNIEKLDAIIVATEECNHGKCTIPVLRSGIHCFCEKPVEMSVEKVDRVVRVARESKSIFQIGYQRRYLPSFQNAMKTIHSGAMGEVTFMQGMWQWTGGVGGRYLDMENAGCWFLAQACHHCDAMAWVMDDQPPVRCVSMAKITQNNVNPPLHCAEDHSAVSFEFPNGAIFSYTHLNNCPEQFTGEKLWVYAEKGGVDLIEGMQYPRPGMGDPIRLGEASSDWDNGTYQELEAFGQHIRNNETPKSNIETARIGTLVGLMGQQAMYNHTSRTFEPNVVTWDDLGTTT